MEERTPYMVDGPTEEPQHKDIQTARLHDEVANLAAVRNEIARVKVQLEAANKALQDLPEFIEASALGAEIVRLKDKERSEMDLVRQIAVADYEEYHSKNPADGVSIRVVKMLEYNTEDARDWVLTNLPKAIIVDTKLFEKHALAVADTAPIPFVEILEVPTATIATKLPGQE
ncbi:MAG: hypothetical protein ABFD24_06045 [Anaerolineaceae bacterium]